jgi:tetratricopeptide (TPR) repeat protein
MRFVLSLSLALLAGSAGLRASAEATKERPSCVIANQALAQGQPQLALTQYQKCLAEGPPSFKTLSNIGMTYAQLSKFDEAIRYYGQALALDTGNPPIRFNLGLAYLKTNRPDQAAKEFARSLMGDPSNIRALELLAVCHFQLKEFELAAFEAEQVLKVKPKEGSALFLLGSSLLHLGMYRDAIPLIYSSIEGNNTPNAHLVLGQAFLGIKVYPQALKEFQQAESMDPDVEGIHSDLGTAYAGMGSTDKAIVEFEKELEKHPDDFDANYSLARLDRLSNHMDAALKYLAKADSLRPGNTSVAYEYAVLAIQDKDYAKAESLLIKILQNMPDYLDAHVLLAEVYFHMHRTADGMREKALVDAMKSAEQARLEAQGKAQQEAYANKAKQDTSSHP